MVRKTRQFDVKNQATLWGKLQDLRGKTAGKDEKNWRILGV